MWLRGVLVTGLLLAVVLQSGCAQIVDPGQRAIKVSLGKLNPNLMGEGLHWYFPLTDRIITKSIKQQSKEGLTNCYSKDLQTMQVRYTVLYKLPEGRLLELYERYSGNIYNELIVPILEDNLKSTASNYTAQEFVNQRDKVKAQMLEQLKDDLNGVVTIVDVPIKNVDLSDELEQAIERKQVQEQEAQAERYRLQKAELEAQRKLVEAKAEAEAIRQKAAALAGNSQLVDLERLKIEQERIKKWNGKAPQTVILGQGSKTSVLLPATTN